MPSLFVILWNLFMSWSKLKIIFSLVKTIKICYLWLSLDASKIYSFKISNICNSFAISRLLKKYYLKLEFYFLSWLNHLYSSLSLPKNLTQKRVRCVRFVFIFIVFFTFHVKSMQNRTHAMRVFVVPFCAQMYACVNHRVLYDIIMKCKYHNEICKISWYMHISCNSQQH